MLSFPKVLGRIGFVLFLIVGAECKANEILGLRNLGSPSEVAVRADGRIYAASANGGVSILETDGTVLDTFAEPDFNAGEKSRPIALELNSLGDVFLADSETNEILVFDQDGVFKSKFATAPTNAPFTALTDLAIGPNGEVYVIDNRELRVFDADGLQQRATSDGWYEHVSVRSNGDLYLGSGSTIRFLSGDNQTQTDFSLPDLYVGPRGPVRSRLEGIYVNDEGVFAAAELHVYKFDHGGDLQFASAGHQNASDVDSHNDNLVIAETSGAFIRVIAEDNLSDWKGRTFSEKQQGPFLRFRDLISLPAFADIEAAVDGGVESTAETFKVPGKVGQPVELTFSFHVSSSGMTNGFGVYNADEIEADPSDFLAFHEEVMREGEVLFDLEQTPQFLGVEPESYHTEGGSELGFFIIPGIDRYPNSVAINFRRSNANSNFPNYSQSRVNVAGYDHMLAFLTDDETFLAFEDLKIGTGNADFGDFTDMIVSVDSRLIPVPEPATFYALFIAICCSCALRRLNPAGSSFCSQTGCDE